MRFRLHEILPILTMALLGLTGCPREDTGACCKVIRPDAAQPPVPDQGDGGPPRNVIQPNPYFDCDSLTCVSYKGSEPVCTRKCLAPPAENNCPEGFDCGQVLTADPGPDASIHPTDYFCVRRLCKQTSDCPKDFKCELVHAGVMGSGQDEPISQCVRSEDHCKP